MYITNDHDRGLNSLMTALLFIFLLSLIVINSPILMTFDILLQDFILGLSFNHSVFNHLLSWLSNPVMVGIYILLIWFLLWGFKHKLIAFWLVCTSLTGEIIFLLIRRVTARPLPTGHEQGLTAGSFPNQHVFSITMVAMLLYICVVPFIRTRWRVWLTTIGLWLVTCLVIIGQIQLQNSYPFDAIASVLLAYSWVEIWEIIYLKAFKRLTQTRIFNHSDFN